MKYIMFFDGARGKNRYWKSNMMISLSGETEISQNIPGAMKWMIELIISITSQKFHRKRF